MYMLRNTHDMEVTVEFILSGLDKTLSTLPGGIMPPEQQHEGYCLIRSQELIQISFQSAFQNTFRISFGDNILSCMSRDFRKNIPKHLAGFGI